MDLVGESMNWDKQIDLVTEFGGGGGGSGKNRSWWFLVDFAAKIAITVVFSGGGSFSSEISPKN